MSIISEVRYYTFNNLLPVSHQDYIVLGNRTPQEIRDMMNDPERPRICAKILGWMVLMSPTAVAAICATDAVAKAMVDEDTGKAFAAGAGTFLGVMASGSVITMAGIKATSVFWKHLKQESSQTIGSSLRSTFSDYAELLGDLGLKILKGATAIGALVGAALSVQAVENSSVDTGDGYGVPVAIFLGVLAAEAAVIVGAAKATSALWKCLKGEYQPL